MRNPTRKRKEKHTTKNKYFISVDGKHHLFKGLSSRRYSISSGLNYITETYKKTYIRQEKNSETI